MKKNIRKKIMAVFLTLAMAVSLMPASTLPVWAAESVWDGTVDTSWYNDTDTSFTISTAEELAGLASLVNAGNDFSGKTVTLGAKIVLNDTTDAASWSSSTMGLRSWTPIGTSINKFNGTFDGGGYTVSGLYISGSSNYVSLFGYADSSAAVKNVGVTDSYIKGKSCGGVAGFSKGTVSNCYNTGIVSGVSIVGGVVGYNDSGTVSSCYNTGSVSGGTNVGGVAGANNSGTITNCRNTGSVSSTGSYTGGVVGYNKSTIETCCNTGSVSSTGLYVGGLVGLHSGGTIKNCYNMGSVSGADYVGGLLGWTNGGTLQYCYNAGGVSGTSSIGGVAGYVSGDGTVTGCYYDSGTSNVSGGINSSTTDGAIGKSTSDMQTATAYIAGTDWENTTIWTFLSGQYPQLVGLPEEDEETYTPTVTSVSPTSGAIAGGTSVTITGTHFTDVSSVYFGSENSVYTVNSDTEIIAESPAAESAGTVDITVTAAGGASAASSADQFTYVAASTYTVSGTVTYSGIAMSGAAVTLKDGSGSAVGTGTTGSDGSYTISDVAAGSYTAVVSALAGYYDETSSASITVSGSNVTGANLILTKSSDAPDYFITKDSSGNFLVNGGGSYTTLTSALSTGCTGISSPIIHFGIPDGSLSVAETSAIGDNALISATYKGKLVLAENASGNSYGLTAVNGVSAVFEGLAITDDTANMTCSGINVRFSMVYVSGASINFDSSSIAADSVKAKAVVLLGGSMIMNGGMISVTGESAYGIENASGSLTINSGTITSSGSAGDCINISGAGTLTVSGGTITNSGYASCIYDVGSGAINLTGGTLTGSTLYAIWNRSSATIIVDGASVFGKMYGIYSMGTGKLTLKSGTVTTSGSAIYNYGAANIEVCGATVSASGYGAYGINNYGAGSIIMSSGTVSGTTYGIYNNSSGNVAISGGTVKSTGNDGGAIYASSKSSGAITVSDTATISSKPASTIKLEIYSAADTAYINLFGAKIYGHDKAALNVSGVLSGSEYSITLANYTDAKLSASGITANYGLAGWTSDSGRTTVLTKVNGDTISNLLNSNPDKTIYANIVPAYTVSGTVTTSTGVSASVGDRTVTLYSSGTATSYSAITATNGTYSIASVPVGTYTAAIAAASGSYAQSSSASFTVSSGNVTDADITLMAESVSTPAVTTTNVDIYTATAATMGGIVTSDGGKTVTERGVVYSSTDSTPEIDETGVIQDANGSGTGEFSERINSLSSSTTYYVRAYAINSVGTYYGEPVSFKTAAADGNWSPVGTEGFSTGSAAYISLAINSGTPYVAYQDSGNSMKAIVMKYDGPSWTPVGTSAGISTGSAEYISLAFDGSTPYMAYRDFQNDNKATVMKYTGSGSTGWEAVGSAGFSAGSAFYISLALDDGTPYVAYLDGENAEKATVMKYTGSGSTGWEAVGHAGFSTGSAFNMSLALDDGTPYVAYLDGGNDNKATVMKYTGSGPNGWEVVGNAGISTGSAGYISLAFDGSTPYVAYLDSGNDNKATVMEYTGSGSTGWEVLGDPDFSAGSAFFISLVFNGGTPYVAYTDGAKKNKVTVMKYNGSVWVTVGDPGFSAGIATYTSLAFDDRGIPYLAFRDGKNSNKVTVMKYGSSVSGTVSAGGTGASVYGLTVTLYSSGTATSYSAITASDGTYTITGVPAGTYTAVISAASGSYAKSSSASFTVSSAGVTGEDITLQAEALNTEPSFTKDDTALLSVKKNASAVSIVDLLHVEDADSGQTLTWTVNETPSHGTLNVTDATASSGSSDITPGGTMTYTPAADYCGTDSFEIEVSDGTATDTRKIDVNVGYWDSSAASGFGGGSGTESDPYKILNAAQLAYLALQVYSGTDYQNTYFKLTSDIDLSGAKWTPIGNDETAFKGIFDGGGHVVSNLATGSGTEHEDKNFTKGLFGSLAGTIKNLGVENFMINNYGASCMGGIAGVLDGGKILNCYAVGNIGSTECYYAGGLTGMNSAGHIYNCYSIVNIKNTVISSGYGNLGSISGCDVGGVNINCYAAGNIEGGGDIPVGALVGYGNGSTLTKCYWNSSAVQTVGGTATSAAVGFADSLINSDTTAMTSDDMKLAEFVKTLNDNAGADAYSSYGFYTWKLVPGKNDGYPMLDGVGSESDTPTYTIAAVSNQTLSSLTSGYSSGTQETKTITITRTGTGDLKNLSVTLSGTNASSFTITQPLSTTLNSATTSTAFTVKANDGLSAGTYTATVTVSADNMTSVTFTVTQTVQSASSGGSHHKDSTTDANTDSNAKLDVNGESAAAGTLKTTTNSDGQKVTSVTVDTGKLETILDKQGTGATVTIPVESGIDVASGILTGGMVKSMENKDATLEIRTDSASYTVPASEINIDAVSSQLGTDVKLSDITVDVSIAGPTDATAKLVADAAADGGFTVEVPAVEFTINCTYNGKTVNVNSFDSYVKRMIAIPDGVDPKKITTGVVVKPDGTTYHVPTQIVQINGVYYAKINSLTNSTYTVIWHPVEFSDVANHWAKDEINDMGSRMVVFGDKNGNYNPGRNMTRAEFAATIVRALGLTPGSGTNTFGDVNSSAWYCGYVETAVSYGIIEGYSAAAFGPSDPVTREQAMAMLERTMKITGLDAGLADSETGKLLGAYSDGTSASAYAKDSIAACLKTGVVSGTSGSMIAPKHYVTRAEVAVMVERLLQKSKLI